MNDPAPKPMSEQDALKIIQALRVRCYEAIESREWVSPTMNEVTALSIILCRPNPETQAVACKHEPFEGKCVHCNVPFFDGRPFYRSPVEAVPVSVLEKLEAEFTHTGRSATSYEEGFHDGQNQCADRLSTVIRETKT